MAQQTITTSETHTEDHGQARCSYLALMMTTATPLSGGTVVLLAQGRDVVIRRGHERHLAQRDRRTLVSVPDGRMSSPHARVVATPRGWAVEDLGSKNGTLVNGAPVEQQVLRDGDVLELGGTFLLFREGFHGNAARPISSESEDIAAFHTLRPDLRERFAELTKVARSDRPVLVRGETGTGKELTARAVHDLSGRTGPFVAINCGALPATLIGAELFGATRGAYSGAVEERKGHIRAADGGTLFLDEIAELSESSQVALLRVLQQSEVTPIGSNESIPVDVRFVAATHQPLEHLIETGRFRQDLYARISAYVTHLPPLRDRREDLGSLIASIIQNAALDRAPSIRFKKPALRALVRYDWPLNIRELDNAIRAALVVAEGDEILSRHLPEAVVRGTPAAPEVPLDLRHPEELKEKLIELHRKHRGNVSAVARELGKARPQIQRWNRQLGIAPDSFRKLT